MSRILEPSPQGLISSGEIKQSKQIFLRNFTYFIERQIYLFIHEISQFGEINFRQPNNHGDLNKRLLNYNYLHIYLFINQEKWVLIIWFKTCSYKIYERKNGNLLHDHLVEREQVRQITVTLENPNLIASPEQSSSWYCYQVWGPEFQIRTKTLNPVLYTVIL